REDAREMGLDRLLANPELLGDLRARPTMPDERGDLSFARRQTSPPARGFGRDLEDDNDAPVALDARQHAKRVLERPRRVGIGKTTDRIEVLAPGSLELREDAFEDSAFDRPSPVVHPIHDLPPTGTAFDTSPITQKAIHFIPEGQKAFFSGEEFSPADRGA